MKNLIIFLFAVVIAAVSQAQEVTQLDEVSIGFAPIDAKVIKTPDGFTFNSDKLSSRHFVSDPIGFMYENFDIENYIAALKKEDYDSYKVSLRSSNGSMVANFDESGNLISTHQSFTNVQLPHQIMKKVYKNYKGWTMTKNKYRASTKGEVINKEFYRITLQKGNKKQNVKLEGNKTGISVASN
ncbi:hypothetical protein [Aquimarina brevivitae]|uniref:PepSY-like beta-lactamase-inhibitor n=1 Tax=Aquimarina brevivitae TaxID=323412 RepID=A0A4Q7NTW2_9FLAO|nr:hypothetical protein [Aquimarina brevivitae]RZS90474.1 hypothetical protein EV197_3461 [Aquimarina brevivitae]